MNPHLAKPHQASGTMLRKLLRTTPLAWLQVKRERMRLLVAVADIAFAEEVPAARRSGWGAGAWLWALQ